MKKLNVCMLLNYVPCDHENKLDQLELWSNNDPKSNKRMLKILLF